MEQFNSFTIPIKKPKINRITAVIISDGKINPFYNLIDKPILESQIEKLKFIDLNMEIVYIGSSECISVKQKFPNIRVIENTRFKSTNDSESIKLALLNNTNDGILIIKNGINLNNLILNNIIQYNDNTTLVTKQISKKVGATIVNGNITYFAYGLEYEWVPICMFNSVGIANLSKITFNDNGNKLFHELLNKYVDSFPIKATII